jgi:hypothetical protein
MGEKMMLQACTKVLVVSCLRWCELYVDELWCVVRLLISVTKQHYMHDK